jgi:hypothetical protein
LAGVADKDQENFDGAQAKNRTAGEAGGAFNTS